jgi:ABC-type bacteriocin/lantibiotic exporter with double-glycine peptidase domain
VALWAQPRYKKSLEKLWTIDNNAKAFLVEAVNSLQTIKALSADSQFGRKWEGLVNQTALAGFTVGQISNVINNLSQVLQRLSGLFILWAGGYLVISQLMTLGQLIAFICCPGKLFNR